MNRTFRNVIFWIHLVVGLVAGLVILVMSLTGTAIAFESQIVEWAERDARRVQVPAPDAARLTVDDLLARVRAARPEAQPSGITVYPEPEAAVLVNLGRESLVYVNPYTGEVKEGGAQGWRNFFHTMEELHRWLAAQGESRAVGKALTGASNVVFLFLAVSGLYLWWPRKWTLRAMRPSLWFRRGLKGKARDWNWHNVIGFWSLPVILVLTASGMVISYRWASDLVFTMTGNAPPANQGPPGGASVKVTPPAPGAERMKLDALFAEARKGTPQWKSMTLRLGGAPRPGGPQGAPGQEGRQGPRGEGRGGEGAQAPSMDGRGAEGAQARAAEGAPNMEGRGGESRGNGEGRGGRGNGEGRGGESRGNGEGRGGGVDALTFTLREQGAWPLFATTQVSLDPFTAQVAKQEGYADYNSGRKLRTWLRFLHTGEALGWIGQLIAAIASFGGSVLVYTGVALALRRFFPRRNASTVSAREAAAAPVQPEPETTA
ncbi:PepSY domain-containing protein [Pyxidicoccus parkwayensis]|uniref:PepSY domain-containing protein n=1 Tax=Pyxidicoccus parkwayensis TaxID=2813578 RepID=A0ABX7P607_9BACT|nr:PepSY-associated TM helix domain-containing protein [Pyxidicoccus parkwaysis]QSQ25886.1 PepSY domain-containing protein [Pyxidicoccus parkwaysis]